MKVKHSDITMLKNMFTFIVICMVALCCEGTVVRFPSDRLALEDLETLTFENEPQEWQTHVMDFINLVDIETVLSAVVRFVYDPEAVQFTRFLLSPKFKDIVSEFESMDEFKEAYTFLTSKGYDVKNVINYVNQVLNLPKFDKPQRVRRQASYNTGVSGYIATIVGALPLQEMRDLIKTKVENNQEVAEFIGAIKSPEFMDIIQRMLRSQKFGEFKSTFESYGVDFNFICVIIREVIDDEYKNVLCGNSQEIYL